MSKEEYKEIMLLGISNGRLLEHIILKKKVLEILRQPLHNLDLSVDYCEERYIKQIEEL